MTTHQGQIVSVSEQWMGSELLQDAAVDTNALFVEGTEDWDDPEMGVELYAEIVGEDELTSEIRPILELDDLNSIVYLKENLAATYLIDSQVFVYPRTLEVEAEVLIDDVDDDEPMTAHVPSHLYDILTPGVRDFGEGESVALEYDGQYYTVTEVLGDELLRDGEYIDPETLPAPTVGDGLPPPDPTVAPVIVRAVRSNIVDMDAYSLPEDWFLNVTEYATSSDAGVTWSAWAELSRGGSFAIHANLDYNLLYKYRFKISDVEGLESQYSPESDAIVPRQVNEGGAVDIAAQTVTSDMLESIIVLTSLLTTRTGGVGLGWEVDQQGIRAYDTTGAVLVNIPTDGSEAMFTGQVTATSIEVVQDILIRLAGTIGSGATVTLANATSDPIAAPDLSWEVDSLPFYASGEMRGLWADSAGGPLQNTPTFLFSTGSGRRWREVTQADPTVSLRSQLVGSSGDTAFGVARLGWIHTLFRMASNGMWRIDVHHEDDMSFVGQVQVEIGSGVTVAAFAVDSQYLYVAWRNTATNKVRVKRFDSFAAYTSTTQDTTVPCTTGYVRDMQIVAGRWWFLCDGVARSCLAGWGAYDANQDFEVASKYGLTHDGSNWLTMDLTGGNPLSKYNDWLPAQPFIFAGYTYRQSVGGYTTATSPRASIARKRRWKLRVNAPPLPGSANEFRAYVLEKATDVDPGAAGLKLQTTIAGGSTSAVLSSYNSLGAASPAVSTFPAAIPGKIASAAGQAFFDGNGRIGLARLAAPPINPAPGETYFDTRIGAAFCWDNISGLWRAMGELMILKLEESADEAHGAGVWSFINFGVKTFDPLNLFVANADYISVPYKGWYKAIANYYIRDPGTDIHTALQIEQATTQLAAGTGIGVAREDGQTSTAEANNLTGEWATTFDGEYCWVSFFNNAGSNPSSLAAYAKFSLYLLALKP